MRRQALLLVAAVSLCYSTTAQQKHVFPKLNIVKTYDVTYINKVTSGSLSATSGKEKIKSPTPYYSLSPRLDLPTLRKQLSTDMRYLKIENRNQGWQDMFQGFMKGAMDKSKPHL